MVSIDSQFSPAEKLVYLCSRAASIVFDISSLFGILRSKGSLFKGLR